MKQTIKEFLKKRKDTVILKKAYIIYIKLRRQKQYVFYRCRIKVKSLRYRKVPLENKIVFSNFNGKGYGCNPKYIAEEIIRRNLPYKLVWLVNDLNEEFPSEIEKIGFNSEESFKELATAKVIVNNVKGDLNFSKKKGQLYIQTWHAGFSTKLLEKAAKKTLSKGYILSSKKNSKDTDLFLSNSTAQSEEYRNTFWCKSEIMECGIPRNDIFFNASDNLKKEIKNRIKIPLEKKVILYAPTFRTESDSLEKYGIDLVKVKAVIEKKFGGDWSFLLRVHPNVNIKNFNVKDNNYINVSKYPDMQELLLISDILITDYSTTMFDMAEMQKIVFLFANDISDYKKLRGLKSEFYDLPFACAENIHELEENILSFDEQEYKNNIKQVNEKYGNFDSGKASSLVVDRIKEWIEKK